jgi:hypothetical protein
MLNSTIQLKIKQRLNKLDSQDYDNIQPWMIVEAFNKAQVDWCRRNLHGLNIVKEGDEQSTRRIDDLEILLISAPLIMNNKQIYYESNNKPGDYLQWKRVSAKATNDCCSNPRPLVIYLAEQANVDELLRDKNKKPSFEWAETFTTQKSDKIQIYTNDEFDIVDTELMYYRQPRKIEIAGVKDPYTGLIPTVDVLSELKDDLIELITDEAAKIISGDIESMYQVQRQQQSIESNN